GFDQKNGKNVAEKSRCRLTAAVWVANKDKGPTAPFLLVALDKLNQSSIAGIKAVLAPPSTYSISPLMPEAKSEHKKAAALPTSSMVTLRRIGALFAFSSSIVRNFLMPDAAKVRIGPAEIPFTRTPSGPMLAAR